MGRRLPFTYLPTTISEADAAAMMGWFAFDNSESLMEVRRMTFDRLTRITEGVDIETVPNAVEINFPNLIETVPGGYLEVGSSNSEQCVVSLPNLISGYTQFVGNIDFSFPKQRVADGVVIMNNPALANLNALDNLTEIVSYFGISLCAILESIPGLSNLVSLGTFNFSSNTLLSSISGFNSVTACSGSFGIGINYNPALLDISGFNSIETINQAIDIQGNNLLANITGFSSLKHIVGRVQILNNPSLTTMSGLSSLISVRAGSDTDSGRLALDQNALTDLSFLNSLEEVQQGLSFINHPGLTTVSLPSLTLLGFDLDARNCALNVASVNRLLAICVAANGGTWAHGLYLGGGTNAAPSGQGIADKATLIGRGATVQTN